VTPPAFNDDLGLLHGVEDFAVEQFVAQLAVEALAIVIFPGTSRFDVGGLGAHSSDPIAQSLGDKLGAIV
jgi:hypothetical protein